MVKVAQVPEPFGKIDRSDGEHFDLDFTWGMAKEAVRLTREKKVKEAEARGGKGHDVHGGFLEQHNENKLSEATWAYLEFAEAME